MSANDKKESITKEEWMLRLEQVPCKQADMNRLIMNYLVTEGFKEAAEKFQQEADIEPCPEFNSLDERILIREAIQKGHVQDATNMVKHLHPQLLANDRYLHFHLKQLQLIELIRDCKIEEAITFAQNNLSEASENIPEAMFELERTLALLAFEKPDDSPFSDLLDQTYRQKIASELNAAILKYELNEDSTPKMMFLVKLIMWSQSKLDGRLTNYPKMKDLATAMIEAK